MVSAAYIEHFFGEDSRRNVEEMILNIKIQFKNNLKRLSWLDEQSSALVVEQFLNTIEDIGSYGDLMEIHLENQAYNEVSVIRLSGSFFSYIST